MGIQTLRQDMAVLEQDLASIQEEYDGLGFFAIGRKRELKKKRAELTASQNLKNTECLNKEEELSKLPSELKNNYLEKQAALEENFLNNPEILRLKANCHKEITDHLRKVAYVDAANLEKTQTGEIAGMIIDQLSTDMPVSFETLFSNIRKKHLFCSRETLNLVLESIPFIKSEKYGYFLKL